MRNVTPQRTDTSRAKHVVALVVLLAVLPWCAHAQWVWTPQTGRWINVKRLPKETAELQVEYARSLLLQGDYKKALNETDKFSSYYSDTEFADDNQFLRGEIKLAQRKHVEAAKEFQQVVAKYPDSSLYEKVIEKQYEIGDALYQQGQHKQQKHWALFKKRPFKRAIEVYSMVINNQPFTEAASEAQYKVGLCHHTRKEYVQAAYEYKRVIEDYSASEWVDDASYGLAMCYYDASLPADYDQEPSRLALNAIDDFTSRFSGDERVAPLGEKRTEMRNRIAEQRLLTAQFYEKRRNFDSARLYYEIVVREFEGTPSAEKAAKWLADNPAPEERPVDRVLAGKRVS